MSVARTSLDNPVDVTMATSLVFTVVSLLPIEIERMGIQIVSGER